MAPHLTSPEQQLIEPFLSSNGFFEGCGIDAHTTITPRWCERGGKTTGLPITNILAPTVVFWLGDNGRPSVAFGYRFKLRLWHGILRFGGPATPLHYLAPPSTTVNFEVTSSIFHWEPAGQNI